MLASSTPFADALSPLSQDTSTLTVSLSNELVQLLSEQLYQSPQKAIEELVVNAYDADASECRVFIPESSKQSTQFIVVYDDGIGMDSEGLENLWHIGRSNKRNEEIERRTKRKQIGKFGIGKLATYTIANKITYLSRMEQEILFVTLDFRDFHSDANGTTKPIRLNVKRILDWKKLEEETTLEEACSAAKIDIKDLFTSTHPSWTFSILEALKPKAKTIRMGRLHWVLSTAMPLINKFHLFLNGDEVISAKASIKAVAEFSVTELPSTRLKSIQESTGEKWDVVLNMLVSESFPRGITGNVMVTEESLHDGKSADIGRSNGFFIRVRERLINETDALFGVKPPSYGSFNRFRADLNVDDLDEDITASRENVEKSERQEKLVKFLGELYLEARERYNKYLKDNENEEKRKKDGERNYVDVRLVEHSVADVLVAQNSEQSGAEADDSWFYLQLHPKTDLNALAHSLYVQQPRSKYRYTYTKKGSTARLVQFDPEKAIFFINIDHDLVQAYFDDSRARILLEDMATSEALLEIYLREYNVPPHIIGSILEQRDALLRSLTRDHPFSLDAIKTALRDSAADQYDLEVALVSAARTLGFVATHISNGGEPDGLARLTDYPLGEQKITLEAKSSQTVPSLAQLDFAGLREHIDKYKAQGCLLVAPSYPGESRQDDSAVANRARETRISCWTIEQLAEVVGAAETRRITAQHVLDVVLKYFSPNDVAKAVEQLLKEPNWDARELYKAVLDALRALEGKLVDTPRTIEIVAVEVSHNPSLTHIKREDVAKALNELSFASQGILTLSENRILIHGSYDEIERRLNRLTGRSGEPRRKGTFRDNFNNE